MVAAPPSCRARDEPGTLVDQGVRDVEVAAAHDAERLSDAEHGQRPADSLRDPHDSALDQGEHAASGCPDPPTIGSGPR